MSSFVNGLLKILFVFPMKTAATALTDLVTYTTVFNTSSVTVTASRVTIILMSADPDNRAECSGLALVNI